MTMIGRGEISTKWILQAIWPTAHIHTQVPLEQLVKNLGYPENLSERQQKETLDILLVFEPLQPKLQMLAVRVQDDRHRGLGIARADRHQKDILEWCKIRVVDLHEDECPELFKERVNYLSFLEVCQQLKHAKVKP